MPAIHHKVLHVRRPLRLRLPHQLKLRASPRCAPSSSHHQIIIIIIVVVVIVVVVVVVTAATVVTIVLIDIIIVITITLLSRNTLQFSDLQTKQMSFP